MGFFGGRKGYFATNAPSHWPRIPLVELNQENLGVAIQQFVAAYGLNRQPPIVQSSFSTTFMGERGFVEVPFCIRDGGRLVPVFVYPNAAPEYASRFLGATLALFSLQEIESVYYCPEPLRPAKPADPYRKFDPGLMFPAPKEDVPSGTYAMWWGDADKLSKGQEPGLIAIGRAYRALDGMESYVLAPFLQVAGVDLGGSIRQALPDNLNLPLSGPDHRIVFLNASKEHGIRFYFHTTNTPPKWRDMFLGHFAHFAELLRAVLVQKKAPWDTYTDLRPSDWWTAMEASHRSGEVPRPPAMGSAGPVQVYMGGLDVP